MKKFVAMILLFIILILGTIMIYFFHISNFGKKDEQHGNEVEQNVETKLYVTIDNQTVIADVPSGDWYVPNEVYSLEDKRYTMWYDDTYTKNNFETFWNELNTKPIIIENRNDVSINFQLSKYGYAINDKKLYFSDRMLYIADTGRGGVTNSAFVSFENNGHTNK